MFSNASLLITLCCLQCVFGAIQQGISLLISPLGDSITWGTGSSDGNGYRQNLLQNLVSTNPITYIGSVKSGTMSNNENEGHPGNRIDQIADQAKNSLFQDPNIILLMAGTNDIVQNSDLANAPKRLGNLIDLVFQDCPRAVVIVASLTPLGDSTRQQNRNTYNAAIPNIINQRAAAGKHILLADMSSIPQSSLDGDGIHPNNNGYKQMAQVWYNAIQAAGNRNWIQNSGPPPATSSSPSKTMGTCSSFPTWASPTIMAVGVGQTDGDFLQSFTPRPSVAVGIQEPNNLIFGGSFQTNWQSLGTIFPEKPKSVDGTVVFADIDGDGRDDYLVVAPNGAVTAWSNTGDYNQWKSLGLIAYGTGASGSQVRFADINCDGLADYVVVNNNTVSVWLNLGPSKWPTWNPKGVTFASSALTDSTARFADLDGDKCWDYIIVDPNSGAVQAFQNDRNFGSRPMGQIFPGVAGSVVQFADMNGDGMADILLTGTSSTVNLRINAGSLKWDDVGSLSVPNIPAGQRMSFPRLSPLKYLDLRADYAAIDPTTGAVRAWKNQGHGETIGEGIRMADLDGDGKADYIFLGQDGSVRAFLNTGDFPTWNDLGTIFPGRGSRNVIFADVNCDGRADYLLVDQNGAVTAWFNPGPNNWSGWGNGVTLANGVGTPGSWVRFADIDGDGCADYLTVNPDDGSMRLWLNTGNFPNWQPVGSVATGIGYPGTKIRLVDVNGDGRDDYVVIKDNGSGVVYTNLPSDGPIPAWGNGQPFADGVGAYGENVILADIDGDSKADYLILNPRTGAMDAFLNKGSGRTGQKGEGVRFADINGDGIADYIWLDVDGAAHVYANFGPSRWPQFNDIGIFTPSSRTNRQTVFFADVNCDGYDDYLVVDPSGGVTAYYNRRTNGPFFADPVKITPGLGASWKSIRFADYDGDGCADYMVVDGNGRLTMWKNPGPNNVPNGWKSSVVGTGFGRSRGEVQLVNIDGDNYYDYLTVDTINGSVHWWQNKGPNSSPSPFAYNDKGVIARGVDYGGHYIQFADVNGDGFPDYLKVGASTASVTVWLNPCKH